MIKHRGSITQGKIDKAVGRHFNQPGHSVADMRICGIERVLPRGNPALRKIRESLWIDRYDCVANGANIRDWVNLLIAIFLTKIHLPTYIYSSAHKSTLYLRKWRDFLIYNFVITISWHLLYKLQLLFVLRREQKLWNRYTKYTLLKKSCCASHHFIISMPRLHYLYQMCI